MRVGLISDTHGHLRPEVFDRLAGVERILHAGDVGPPEVLLDLARLATLRIAHGHAFSLRAFADVTHLEPEMVTR